MVMDDLINEIDQYYLDKLPFLKKRATCLRRKVAAILVRNPFKCYSGNYAQVDFNNEETLDFIKVNIRTNLRKDIYTVSEGVNTSLTEETCESEGKCLVHNGHCIRTMHAEIFCILTASIYQRDQAWMYISTAPCYKCLQEIAYVGIKRIIVEDLNSWQTRDFEKPCRKLIEKYQIELVEKSI